MESQGYLKKGSEEACVQNSRAMKRVSVRPIRGDGFIHYMRSLWGLEGVRSIRKSAPEMGSVREVSAS